MTDRNRSIHMHRFVPMLASALVLVVVGCGEETTAPSAPETRPALATTSAALSFRQISTGMYHSCGVTTDNVAYCWGYTGTGQIGDGTTNTPGDELQRPNPVAVVGGLHFLQVSAGFDHTCGVTTDNRVYCWGSNARGQMGNGTFLGGSTPVAVVGARRFRQVSAGYVHTCAVSLFDVAFCWGNNDNGRLGDGTRTEHLWPVRVHGALRFRRVVAGGFHTCGVTTGSRAYCWGRNEHGQLGDGTITTRLKPVAVGGGLSFRQVSVGAARIGLKWQSVTCGLTTDSKAYCWGDNLHGQLGDGSTTQRTTPVAVMPHLQFSQVNTGGGHTCAITTDNSTYCWGHNARGQLGDGSSTGSLTPVAVSGGNQFRAVSTGGGYGGHTCGLTMGDRAYCWGLNYFGQLGDGTAIDRLAPVPVAGPL
jgi:alpha-tubulin suppressor-like RCC1 family protein